MNIRTAREEEFSRQGAKAQRDQEERPSQTPGWFPARVQSSVFAFLRLGVSSSATLALAAALAFTTSARAGEITLHAAASLTAALHEIAPAFETSSGHKLKLVFGNSDELARALKEGGPGDVFFSASDETMDALEKAKLLVEGTRQALLSNGLVVIVPHGDIGTPAASAFDLATAEVKKVGLVKPESVPGGVYAREYLKKAKLWERVKDKVVSFESTAALLAAIDATEIEAAIIFKTDALISKKARIAAEIPADQAPRITYALALTAASRQPEPASELVLYLAGAKAAPVFEKYGFIRLRAPQ